MVDKQAAQPKGDDRWGDLALEVVDDVPEPEQGEGMTPEEIRAFLERPVAPEEGQ